MSNEMEDYLREIEKRLSHFTHLAPAQALSMFHKDIQNLLKLVKAYEKQIENLEEALDAEGICSLMFVEPDKIKKEIFEAQPTEEK